MRTRFLILMMAVGMILASCHGREAALTGGYGSGVVSGQVAMADGSSPAGVKVAVVGTGMASTLAADGHFMFAGVPDNAELQFTGNGVEARMAVAPSSKAMNLVLSANGVQSGRARGPKKTEPQQQYEGTITAITAATTTTGGSITVHDSHGNDPEIFLTDGTVIRSGNTILTLADLAVNDHVHVQAYVLNGVLTASLIIKQGTDDTDTPGQTGGTIMTANGVVKSVGPIVVGSQPHGDVTVNTDANTIVRQQGARISPTAIQAGWYINAMGTKVDDHTLLARQIEVRGSSTHH